MKQKDDGSKWLIPNRSNSSPSHAVSRLNRPSEPQGGFIRPEDAPPQAGGTPSRAVNRTGGSQGYVPQQAENAQSHAVTRVNRSGGSSQGYEPPQAISAQSHAVTRTDRSGGSSQGYEPPQAISAQSHAVTRTDRSGSSFQGYEPPQAVSAQSHAVVRRRSGGSVPEITPAPKLQPGGASGVPQQSLPAGAGHEVSHVPERFGRKSPAISPEVPPVTGGSMVPKRIQGNQVSGRQSAESAVSGYVPRVSQPEPYGGGHTSSNVVQRVRQIPQGNISETKLTPLLQKPQMDEMPTVGGENAGDSGNQFAGRWSFPEE